jgi:hypothetical protein
MSQAEVESSRPFDDNFASDYILANMAAAGVSEAFAVLYRRHFRRAQALCLRMTANFAEAEDLRQDVFVSLWRKIGTFRGEAAFCKEKRDAETLHRGISFSRSDARQGRRPKDALTLASFL